MLSNNLKARRLKTQIMNRKYSLERSRDKGPKVFLPPNKYFYRLGRTTIRSKGKYESKLDQKNYGIRSIFLMKERFRKDKKPLYLLNKTSKISKKVKAEKLNTVSSLNLIHGESLKSLIDEHNKNSPKGKKPRNGYMFSTKNSKIFAQKNSDSKTSKNFASLTEENQRVPMRPKVDKRTVLMTRHFNRMDPQYHSKYKSFKEKREENSMRSWVDRRDTPNQDYDINQLPT